MGTLKDKAKHYVDAFDGAHELADEDGRLQKAEKIRAVLKQEGISLDDSSRILDIGCSFGLILRRLVSDTGFGVGIDMDQSVMKEHVGKAAYVCADAETLPFRRDCFDVVICNHVYEHTDSPEEMMAEIERVLTSTGVCYFAGPSKHDVIEPHYRLPFLSWLPRALADLYLRLTGKGQHYAEKPYSYYAMKKLLSRFEVMDYTAKIIVDPSRYRATDMLQPRSLKRFVALILFKYARFLFPSFVFVLRKKARSTSLR